jgi:hypothetical protein
LKALRKGEYYAGQAEKQLEDIRPYLRPTVQEIESDLEIIEDIDEAIRMHHPNMNDGKRSYAGAIYQHLRGKGYCVMKMKSIEGGNL